MPFLKKLSASILIGTSIFTLTPFTSNATSSSFPDINSDHPFAIAVENIRADEIVNGYPDGKFRLNNNINRAEFTKIVIGSVFDKSEISGKNCFPDVDEEWFAPFVCTAKREGIISGYEDGTFRPSDPINFAEASKIIANTFELDLPSNVGNKWFEQFAKALAEKNAVPVTVEEFAGNLTRGELAEITYRLREKKEDKPSLDYSALEASSQTGATDNLPQIRTCSELSERMRLAAASQPSYRYDMLESFSGATLSKTTSAPSEQSDSASADYSTTNVQVSGVDEADVVKNDGEYIYFLRNNQSIHIVKAYPADEMEEVAVIRFTDLNPSEIYVADDILVVIGSDWRSFIPTPLYEDYYPRSTSWTKAVIFDISDRSDPQEVRTIEFEGSYQTSRLINDDLYLVMNQYPNYRVWLEEYDEDSLLPQFRDSEDSVADKPIAECQDIHYFPGLIQPQYLIVAGIDITDESQNVSREVYLGSGTNVYSSAENLYVATTTREPYQITSEFDHYVPPHEKTRIYKFELDDGEVNYQSQGEVPGTILNQFSMDEYDDHFRVATTESPRFWGWRDEGSNVSKNNIFVLDNELKQVGEIRDIAPGERIYSARFMGKKGYLVTFRKIDPFFVIDLADHENPEILGKLKIPGYSDYLHPYDENHIIGFGKDTESDKTDTFSWYQGFKMAVFDVTDVENPKELFKEVIGDRGTDSELLRNHKALLFSKTKNLLAFPITIAEIADKENAATNSYGEQIFQGAMVYSLDLDNGFEERGRITHYSEEDLLKAGSHFYGDQNINRTLYIGDTLYTLSNSELKANELDDLDEIGGLEF